MGIYNNYSCGFGNIGRTWAPKRQRLMVGRDLSPLQEQCRQRETNGIILSDSAKLLDNARKEYASAQSQTRLGFSLRKDVTTSPAGGRVQEEQLLGSSASESVYLVNTGGQTRLRIVDADGEGRMVNLSGQEDIRIAWTEDGRAEVFTGEAALTGGKLVAQGENDIMVRLSSADVEAGSGSTVLNLSGKGGGNFSGGHDVRYLGAYDGAYINGGTGANSFEGYFGNCRITADKGKGEFCGVFHGMAAGSFLKTGDYDDVFSGHFMLMNVTDSGGKNIFSGSFLTGCKLEGGSGDDTFSGQFFDSKIKDEGGDNTFGSYMNLKNKVNLNFVRTAVEAGGGNDRFMGAAEQSNINLGGGDDEATGILLESALNVGAGADKVKLLYSSGSFIDMGKGDDDLHLISGAGNSVYLGADNDKMTSGLNAGNTDVRYGTISAYAKSAFLTEEQARSGLNPKFGHHFGDVRSSNIDASEGENEISVHDGRNVHSVKSGENRTEEGASSAHVSSGSYSDTLDNIEILDGETRADMAMQNTLANTLKKMLSRTRSSELAPDMSLRLEGALRAMKEKQTAWEKRPASDQDCFLVSMVGGWLPDAAGNSVTVSGGNGETVQFDRLQRNIFQGNADIGGSPLRPRMYKYRQHGGINSQAYFLRVSAAGG